MYNFVKKDLNISKGLVADPMKVIELEEYRKARRIKELSKEDISTWSARERLVEHLKEKLRQRLRERMRLEELKKKQSEPPTKK